MRTLNHKIRAIAGIAVVLCAGSGVLRANVAIKPSYVEVDLQGKRPTGVFYVSNLSDKEARFRVNAVHFNYTEDGGLQMAPTGENSIAPWIRFNPRELTLAPKSQRAVRFAIVPRGPVDQGEHWAGMELESLDIGETSSGDPNTGHAIKVRSSVSLLAPIFATAGQTTYQGEITDVQVHIERGVPVLKTMVVATGSGRLGLVGTYEVLDDAGKTVKAGSMGACYVFRGGHRWVKQRVDGIPEGQYTVRINFKAAHLEQPLAIERQVVWPSQPPVAAESAAPAQAGLAEGAKDQPQSSTDGNRRSRGAGKRRRIRDMKKIRRGVGVCVVLGLCVPFALCLGVVSSEHGGVQLPWDEAIQVDFRPVFMGFGPARLEGNDRPADGTFVDIFADGVSQSAADTDVTAAEPCEPNSFIGPVFAIEKMSTGPNRLRPTPPSGSESSGDSGNISDVNGPGAAVTAVFGPDADAPRTVNELIGFVVRGRMAHERLQIDDLDSLAPNGERRLPLLRILRTFQVKLEEQAGVFRFAPDGVGPVELDVPNGQLQIGGQKRDIKLVQAVSDITLKADIYVSPEDLEEILDVKLEWNSELYEYRIQMDRSLSIWAVTAGGPLNLTDIQYMGADLPSVLPPADRSQDAIQFVQLDWQTGYGWHHTEGAQSDVHRVTFGSPRETLWGNVYDGQYKLRMSHPAANWSSGNGLRWTNEEQYAARLDWFEWVRRLPSAEITLGDSSSGLSDLVCPIVATTGVRINGLIGWTPEEMASDRSRLGLRQYFGRPLLFEGPAPIGATVQLVLNGREIGTQNVLPEPGSAPGMGIYRFEDIELAYGILNEITLVIKETNGSEIRVEKTMMGTPQLVPQGRTAYLGLAGARRDRRVEDLPAVDTGEFSGYLTGGRILHGVTDRLTVGVTAAGQEDYFRRYTEDTVQASDRRVYPESSQHGGVTLSYLPFDKLQLSSDLAGSEAQASDGYGDLAARVRADYLPTQRLTFNADLLNLGSDYFDGVDPEVANRRGGEAGMIWRWNKLWTLEAGLGEIGDNVDGDQDDTLVVDYRNVGLMTTALPRSSLTAKLHHLQTNGESDDAMLLELRLRVTPIRDISVYGQIFTGDDMEIEENDRFLSSLRLRNAPRFLHPSQYWTISKRFNRNHMTSVSYGDTEEQDTLAIAHDVRVIAKSHPLNLRAELLHKLSGDSEEKDRFRFRADYMLDPFGNNQFGTTAEFSDNSYAVYCYMSIQSLFSCHRNRLVHINETRIRTAYGAIHGKVFLDYNGNHLLDVNEPGVPDVKVSLNQFTSAVTDKRGYYILSTSANAAEARVYLDAETVPAVYTVTNGAQSAKTYRDSLTEVNLSVAPLISLTGRLVGVDPNAGNRANAEPNAVDPNAPDLSPTVIDGVDTNDVDKPHAAQPAPLGGVRICLTDVASSLLVADSVTGNDGVYYFDDVKPGRYRLSVDPKTVPPTHVLAEQERIIVVEPTREEGIEVPMPDITALVQKQAKPADDQKK